MTWHKLSPRAEAEERHHLAAVADPTSPGEVVAVEWAAAVDRSAAITPPVGAEILFTDLACVLRSRGLARQVALTGSAPDGYPVHDWLVLPDGPGPHPVLLDVHGGPHAAYNWGLFDESQVYAGAGYAVVLPNPRGSAG